MYIIGTKNEAEVPDFCIITWIGFSFDKTPHLMMTIGGNKQTKTNILRDKMFSANLISEDIFGLQTILGLQKLRKNLRMIYSMIINGGII